MDYIEKLNRELDKERLQKQEEELYKRLAIDEESDPMLTKILVVCGVLVFSFMMFLAIIAGLTYHVWKSFLN